jgi:hypothetical protein
LRAAFGLGVKDDIQPLLDKLATAALTEYRDTFFGDGLFTTAADFRQRRLLLLIEHAFDGMPDERQIASLLHLTPSQAKNLLNAISVKFAERLRAKIDADVKAALRKDFDSERDNSRSLFIRSATTRQAVDDLIDELNRQKPEGPYAAKLIRHATINGLFEIGEPTLKELKASLGI